MKLLMMAAFLLPFFASAETVCREDFGGQYQQCVDVQPMKDGSVSLFKYDSEGDGGVTYLPKGEDEIIFYGTKEEIKVSKVLKQSR
ncbi:hypothetical protein AB5R29_000296 [Enterobacter hormaechei]